VAQHIPGIPVLQGGDPSLYCSERHHGLVCIHNCE